MLLIFQSMIWLIHHTILALLSFQILYILKHLPLDFHSSELKKCIKIKSGEKTFLRSMQNEPQIHSQSTKLRTRNSQKYTAMESESLITLRSASPSMSSMKSAVGSFSVSSHDSRFSSFFMSPAAALII